MNWSKAKTILIILLTLANFFLAFILVRSTINSTRIPSETIANTISILNERSITIDSKLIPNRIEKKKIYTVENIISDYKDFAKKVLGDSFIVSGNKYATDSAELEFDGDRFKINYFGGYTVSENSSRPEDTASNYLQLLGIDTKSASHTVNETENNLKTIVYTMDLGNSPFFGCEIAVSVSDNKILDVNGCWFIKTETHPTSQAIESIPSILVKLSANNPDFANTEILEINFGYSIGEEKVFHKNGNVLPVYEIVCSNNKSYFVYAI